MSYGGEIVLELVTAYGYSEGRACEAVLRHNHVVLELAKLGFISTAVAREIARVDRSDDWGEDAMTNEWARGEP